MAITRCIIMLWKRNVSKSCGTRTGSWCFDTFIEKGNVQLTSLRA
ncbi:hypothetical protein LINPERHAP1_LOCUS41236 [Linum perenne]